MRCQTRRLIQSNTYIQGACMTLLWVRVYYVACESMSSTLASFQRTSAGPDMSSIVTVPGTCVDHSEPYVDSSPLGFCTADGSWLVSGGCVCQAGYQVNSSQCSGTQVHLLCDGFFAKQSVHITCSKNVRGCLRSVQRSIKENRKERCLINFVRLKPHVKS